MLHVADDDDVEKHDRLNHVFTMPVAEPDSSTLAASVEASQVSNIDTLLNTARPRTIFANLRVHTEALDLKMVKLPGLKLTADLRGAIHTPIAKALQCLAVVISARVVELGDWVHESLVKPLAFDKGLNEKIPSHALWASSTPSPHTHKRPIWIQMVSSSRPPSLWPASCART